MNLGTITANMPEVLHTADISYFVFLMGRSLSPA